MRGGNTGGRLSSSDGPSISSRTIRNTDFTGMMGGPSGFVFLHYWLAKSLSELGQFAEATLHSREALRIAETSHQPQCTSSH